MKHLSRILILVALLTFNTTGADTILASEHATTHNIERNSILASNWMSYLPDNAPITELNLPGSHNAACLYFKNVPYNYEGISVSTSLLNKYGKTQSLTITEQLEAGTRVLDCRAAYAKSVDSTQIIVPHNMLVTADKMTNGNPITVEMMVNYAKDFVKKHPSETVVVAIDRDGRTYDTKSDEFKAIENKLYDSLSADSLVKVYEYGDTSPLLKDVRGHVVVMNTDDMSSFGGDSSRKADVKWETVKSFMDAAPAQQYEKAPILTKNDDNRKLARPCQLNTTTRGEEERQILGIGIPHPEENAKIMNNYIQNYNLEVGKFYGWFFMDFVSEDLNRKVFLSNKLVMDLEEEIAETIQSIKATTIGNITLKSKNKRITLTWKKGTGITPTRYYIYRSTNKNKNFKLIKSTTNSTRKYTDQGNLKKGKRYYYKVYGAKKVNGKYYKTKASAIKSIKCK